MKFTSHPRSVARRTLTARATRITSASPQTFSSPQKVARPLPFLQLQPLTANQLPLWIYLFGTRHMSVLLPSLSLRFLGFLHVIGKVVLRLFLWPNDLYFLLCVFFKLIEDRKKKKLLLAKPTLVTYRSGFFIFPNNSFVKKMYISYNSPILSVCIIRWFLVCSQIRVIINYHDRF